jgi:hypothetical protein
MEPLDSATKRTLSPPGWIRIPVAKPPNDRALDGAANGRHWTIMPANWATYGGN